MVCAACRDNPRDLASVDLAHYGVSRSKDWVSVDCGTMAKWMQNGLFRHVGGA